MEETSSVETRSPSDPAGSDRPGGPNDPAGTTPKVDPTGLVPSPAGPRTWTNPFVVPGSTANPDRPLCPWKTADHDGWYVSVDDTENEFRRFKLSLTDVRDLLEYGRLVVVGGAGSCGKTALVNRCAYWTMLRLTEAGIRPVVVPLQRAVDEAIQIPRRRALVAERVIQHLSDQRLIDYGPEMERLLNQPEQDGLYAHLSSALRRSKDKPVALVLLPPTRDAVEELRDYARFAQARIMFFAETDFIDLLSGDRAERDRAGDDPAIELSLGPLNPEDFWLFAADRMHHHDREGVILPMSEETMRRFRDRTRSPWTVKQLQWVLREAFEDVGREPGPGRPVTIEDLAVHGMELFRTRGAS